MPSIMRRENKDGPVFRIRVTDRRRNMQFSMTWPEKGEKIPESWNEKRIEKEVQRIAFEYEAKCLHGSVSKEHITFGEYAKYAIEQKERDGVKHRTVVRYRELLNRINDKKCLGIGDIRLKDLRPEDLNDFYAELAKPGMNRLTGGSLSGKTIAEYHRLISTVLQMALKERKVGENVAKLASRPKSKRPEIQSLEIDEVNAVLEALKDEPLKYQAITNLLIATGARRGEIIGLKWEDVSFERRTINICRNLLYAPDRGIYEDTTKTGVAHTVTVSASSLEPLKAWRVEQMKMRMQQGEHWENTNYVFTRNDGRPMSPDTITQWLKKFSDRHGLPHVHPHLFRHTHASILIASHVDVVSVSKRLGHSKVSTTEDFYAHALRGADQQASDVFDRMLHSRMAM